MERPGRREFAELVTDHLFRDINRDELVAVVNVERQTDELRQYRRAARPRLDGGFLAAALRRFRLLQQIAVDKRAFPN